MRLKKKAFTHLSDRTERPQSYPDLKILLSAPLNCQKTTFQVTKLPYDLRNYSFCIQWARDSLVYTHHQLSLHWLNSSYIQKQNLELYLSSSWMQEIWIVLASKWKWEDPCAGWRANHKPGEIFVCSEWIIRGEKIGNLKWIGNLKSSQPKRRGTSFKRLKNRSYNMRQCQWWAVSETF